MKQSGCLLSLVLMTLISPPSWADSSVPTSIRICDDGAQWPPYTFYLEAPKTHAIGQPIKLIVSSPNTAQLQTEDAANDAIRGYSVDVAGTILNANHIDFSIELPPWKRCIHEVEIGGIYQMLLSASYNQERSDHLLLSDGYYQTHAYYFYSKQHFPHGPKISHLGDLKKFHVGGISGYNYTYLGIDPTKMDLEALEYHHLFRKLQSDRIDILVAHLEIINGFKLSGTDYLADPDIGYAPLPDLQPISYHMMFPRTEQGLALKRIMDEGIQKMRDNGELERMLKHYTDQLRSDASIPETKSAN